MKFRVLPLLMAFFLVPVILLSGCSSVPTSGVGKKVLSMKWAEEAKVISFKSFKEEELELFGNRIFRMSYEAEIEYVKDVPGILFVQGHKKGDRETVTGTLTFTKKEKGWEGEDGNIYNPPFLF